MSAVAEVLPLAKPETPFRRLTREFFSNRVATASFAVLMTIVFLAIFAPLLSPQNPYDLARVTVMDARLEPGERGSAGFVMWLGADGAGRDMLSAMLYGLRISLGVGVASGVIALAIGTAVGLLAAYRGGWIDALIMRLVDLQLSFPAILVALILVAILGRGADKVMIALILVQWAYYARTVRGAALVERRKEYIEAAQCLALPPRRIVFRHLLPNVIAPMIVVGTLQTAHAISLEATLSFLGVGLPLTEPSLGLLIANGFEYMLSGKYWISFYPGLALLATIMSINLVGDRLRDVLNPRLER
jgi:peptide/nickel transport system permease protein